MADYRDDLIRLFASNRVDQIEQNEEFQQLCAAHDGDPAFGRFKTELHLVWRAKTRLEKLLDKPFTRSSEQVRAALEELRAKRGDPDQELYYKLIMASDAPEWSEPQTEYFQRAWSLLQSKYDFFFSHTTRRFPPDEDNLVNVYYQHFISVYGDSTKLGKPDAKQKNQLAYTINRLLSKDKRYAGFFFETHANDNQEVELKLRQACRSSFVFVQLVQNIMFRPPDKPPNYCFIEYKEAVSYILPGLHGDQRILFIVAEDSPKALLHSFEVPEEYQGWYSHLRSKAALYLQKFGVKDDARIWDVYETLEKNVTNKQGDVWQLIFKCVPN